MQFLKGKVTLVSSRVFIDRYFKEDVFLSKTKESNPH